MTILDYVIREEFPPGLRNRVRNMVIRKAPFAVSQWMLKEWSGTERQLLAQIEAPRLWKDLRLSIWPSPIHEVNINLTHGTTR